MRRRNGETIEQAVLDVLKNNEVARESDDILYLEVLRRKYPFIESRTVGYLFTNREAMKLPTFESVRRSRAFILAQERYKDLRPSTSVCERRRALEEKLRKYYGGNDYE